MRLLLDKSWEVFRNFYECINVYMPEAWKDISEAWYHTFDYGCIETVHNDDQFQKTYFLTRSFPFWKW